MTAGILFGLGAALAASISYLLTRLFMVRVRSSMRYIFSISSIHMGIFSLLLLPFAWDSALPPWRAWIFWCLGTSTFFLIGQMLLMRALKTADSSQVAPLLGLKVAVLAMICVFLLRRPLNLYGWSAIGMFTVAGFIVAPPTLLHNRKTMLWVVGACLAYSLSNLCIPELVHALRPASKSPALLGVCFSYILNAIVGTGILLRQKGRLEWRAHAYALPYAIAWYLSILALYACFSRIGVVYGSMLQSMRGFINVLAAFILVHCGWHALESVSSWRTLLWRACGAVLMITAIILYHLSAGL